MLTREERYGVKRASLQNMLYTENIEVSQERIVVLEVIYDGILTGDYIGKITIGFDRVTLKLKENSFDMQDYNWLFSSIKEILPDVIYTARGDIKELDLFGSKDIGVSLRYNNKKYLKHIYKSRYLLK